MFLVSETPSPKQNSIPRPLAIVGVPELRALLLDHAAGCRVCINALVGGIPPMCFCDVLAELYADVFSSVADATYCNIHAP